MSLIPRYSSFPMTARADEPFSEAVFKDVEFF